MNFKRFLKHDIGYKAKGKYPFLLLGMLITVIYYIGLYNDLLSVKLVEKLKANGTFMDYWICLVQGKEDYKFSVGEVYDFPVYWFLLFVFLLIPVNAYVWNDIKGYGQQVMIRSKSRKEWLASKYLWVLSVVFMYFILLLTTTILFCMSQKAAISLKPSWYMMELFGRTVLTDFPIHKLLIFYFVQPFLLMLLFCYLEVTVLLFLPPSMSFMCCSVILIASLYKKTYLLIGNWGIPVRMRGIDEAGLLGPVCIFMMLLVIALLVITGCGVIARKDIL